MRFFISFRPRILVLEFEFDSKKINTTYNNIWYHRAGVSLAEAIRLAAGKILDIDFSELVTGCRYRNDKQGCFLDVYLYDDLLSVLDTQIAFQKSLARY